LKLITFYVPEPYLEALDSLVPERFPTRAEAIRLALRDLLINEGCLPKAEVSARVKTIKRRTDKHYSTKYASTERKRKTWPQWKPEQRKGLREPQQYGTK